MLAYAPRCKNSKPQVQPELVQLPKLEATYASRKSQELPVTRLMIARPPDSPKPTSSPVWDPKNGDDGLASGNSGPVECYELQASSCQVRMPFSDQITIAKMQLTTGAISRSAVMQEPSCKWPIVQLSQTAAVIQLAQGKFRIRQPQITKLCNNLTRSTATSKF